ncbi:MAG: ribonuclease III [Gammaproteobacteria bacterium]
MSKSLDSLCQRLDYHFADPSLLENALTHRSAGSRNNERLEFLGDAVLNFVIAAELYERSPAATEGELSRLRASLVKQETLASLARSVDLGRHLTLGSGEMKSGGQRRDSILADGLEAVFGAVYLDGGFDACRRLIGRLYQDRLDSLPEATSLTDAKTRLQEYLQSRRLPLPVYHVIDVSGEPHAQTFTVVCNISRGTRTLTTQGSGSSRRRAEQNAAHQALKLLQDG